MGKTDVLEEGKKLNVSFIFGRKRGMCQIERKGKIVTLASVL